MYDRVTPTREAFACLATFASASCVVHSSAASTSAWSIRHRRQRTGQPRLIPDFRAGRLDGPPDLGQADPRESGRIVEVPPPLRGAVVHLLHRLQLGDDADKPLREGVMDLARHALPLVEDTRLACLRQQLGVQASVFLQGSFEFGERRRRCSLSSRTRSPMLVPNPMASV
jgi:hypothetical protein